LIRKRYVIDLNSIVRKHKRIHERRRRLPAAPNRAAISAQTGRAEVGSEESV
jgi:hypothetical protein